MAKRIFDVSQEAERLILVKRCGPALESMLWVSIVALFFGVLTWRANAQGISIVGLFLIWATLIWAVAASITVREFTRAVKGDIWIFDRDKGHLERSGSIQSSLSDLVTIEIIEDKEAGLCHKLLLHHLSGRELREILLEENACQLEEVVNIAQLIADFTGLPLRRR